MPVVSPWRDVGGNGERGAERRVVHRHHRHQVQAARIVGGQRRADDAAAIADDERHFLWRAQRSGDDEVAFVFAVVVVGDGDDFAARESLDGLIDGAHFVFSRWGRLEGQEIVGGDGAGGLGDDALGGFARNPGAFVATDLGHGAGGNPDAAREFGASHAVAIEPVGELHSL